MEMLSVQIPIVATILVAAFSGPAIAFFFLLRRKRLARARRRSPVNEALLRSPGHSLRIQLTEANDEVIFDLMSLVVFPSLLVATFFAQSRTPKFAFSGYGSLLYAVVGLVLIVYFVRKLLKASIRLDQLRAGYDAELAVGQELDQLMRRGAFVFHDIPADNFNIDHVVIAAEGVFAVETKGYTKPNQGRGRADATVVFDGSALTFPMWTTKEPLEQADRQAKWLAKWLTRAVGSPVHVLPVVALPGWFVERTGRQDVRVFSGKELPGLLKSRGTQALSAQEVQRIAHQVEQRCRTVSPLYADEKRASPPSP